MGRYAKDTGGGDFQDAPIGTHIARCIRLIDLGTHESEYQGTKTKRNQIVVGWELPTELMDDQQPFIVHKFYTNSLSEKSKLRPDLEAWRGRPFSSTELDGFDLEQILGKCCLVSVIAKQNGGVKVGGLMALPKGTKVPPAHNDCWAYWIESHSEDAFAKVPKGFQKMIMESDEMRDGGPKREPGEDADEPKLDDEIPF